MDKRIAMITGSGKGIGASIAEELAKEGYNLILHYNNSDAKAKELKNYLRSTYNVDINLLKADLSQEQDINNLVSSVKSITNKIDVLINNAALSLDNDIFLKTKSEFMSVLEVNIIAPFLLIQGLYNNLNGGTIINISSTDAINTGSLYNVDYCASKAGLNIITNILGTQLPDVRIVSLAPNWVKTESVLEMEPEYLKSELDRINQKELILPEVVAKKIISIINDKSILSGSIVRLDGNYE